MLLDTQAYRQVERPCAFSAGRPVKSARSIIALGRDRGVGDTRHHSIRDGIPGLGGHELLPSCICSFVLSATVAYGFYLLRISCLDFVFRFLYPQSVALRFASLRGQHHAFDRRRHIRTHSHTRHASFKTPHAPLTLAFHLTQHLSADDRLAAFLIRVFTI